MHPHVLALMTHKERLADFPEALHRWLNPKLRGLLSCVSQKDQAHRVAGSPLWCSAGSERNLSDVLQARRPDVAVP